MKTKYFLLSLITVLVVFIFGCSKGDLVKNDLAIEFRDEPCDDCIALTEPSCCCKVSLQNGQPQMSLAIC